LQMLEALELHALVDLHLLADDHVDVHHVALELAVDVHREAALLPQVLAVEAREPRLEPLPGAHRHAAHDRVPLVRAHLLPALLRIGLQHADRTDGLALQCLYALVEDRLLARPLAGALPDRRRRPQRDQRRSLRLSLRRAQTLWALTLRDGGRRGRRGSAARSAR